jgi:hypothetical protein
MVLELMGYLVSFYRHPAFGLAEDETGSRSAPGRRGEGPDDA